MSKHREDSYVFCATLAKACENKLLPKEDLIKAAEAKDFYDAMAVVSEYGYGDGKSLENPRDFVNVLTEEQERISEYVISALEVPEDLNILKVTKDYHNVKAILKAEFLGIDPKPYMVWGGCFSQEKLISMIKERELAFFSTEMKASINEATELFGKSRDPQQVDIILDKACYAEMSRMADEFENEFIQGYVRLLIDTLNVISFVRLRQMGKPWTFFQRVFLEGGNMQESLFFSGYEENYQQVADKFEVYGFREIIEKGAITARNTGLYSLMEKLCDNKLMEYLKGAKYVSFGIEPVFAFLLAKESEAKNLRMILTGKIACTPKEVILERLRETYV